MESCSTLSQARAISASWPFNGWTLNGTSDGTGTTLSFTMAKTDHVDANYYTRVLTDLRRHSRCALGLR